MQNLAENHSPIWEILCVSIASFLYSKSNKLHPMQLLNVSNAGVKQLLLLSKQCHLVVWKVNWFLNKTQNANLLPSHLSRARWTLPRLRNSLIPYWICKKKKKHAHGDLNRIQYKVSICVGNKMISKFLPQSVVAIKSWIWAKIYVQVFNQWDFLYAMRWAHNASCQQQSAIEIQWFHFKYNIAQPYPTLLFHFTVRMPI